MVRQILILQGAKIDTPIIMLLWRPLVERLKSTDNKKLLLGASYLDIKSVISPLMS